MTAIEARRLLRDLNGNARGLLSEMGFSGLFTIGYASRVSTDVIREAGKLERTLTKIDAAGGITAVLKAARA